MRLSSIPEITKCDHCGLIQEDILCGKARLEISQQSLGNTVHDGSSVSKNANTISGEFRTPLGPKGVQTRRTLQWSRDNGGGFEDLVKPQPSFPSRAEHEKSLIDVDAPCDESCFAVVVSRRVSECFFNY